MQHQGSLLTTLKRVERWASGYGTATQTEMRQWVREAIADAKCAECAASDDGDDQ